MVTMAGHLHVAAARLGSDGRWVVADLARRPCTAVVLLDRPRPEAATSRFIVPVSAALVAMLVWSGQLTGFAVADAVRWPITLWTGVVRVAGMAAAALTVARVVIPAARRPVA